MKKSKRPGKLKNAVSTRLRTQMTVIVVSSVSILAMIIGIFVYVNLSNSEKSKARDVVANAEAMPVDFNLPKVAEKKAQLQLNGINCKKVKQAAGNE